MVTVVDNQSCNTGSVINMLKKIGVKAKSTSVASEIAQAERIILPGVGAFDTAMLKLKELGLIEALNERALEAKVPTLGICLGMQLLSEKSEEGSEPGLGWIPGEVKKFNLDQNHKLPHMGWNHVKAVHQSELLQGYERDPKFYFVHSYHFSCDDQFIIGKVEYGYDFPCIVGKDNIVGAQFHPEKSHKYGMKFLSQFMEHYK